MANSDLKMTVSADAKQAIGSLSSVVSSIAKTTVSITAAVNAAKRLYQVSKELVELGAKEALAEERLKAVLTATGNSASVTYSKMEQLASSISGLTGIEEQSIYQAEQVLVAFGTLNSEGLERTLQLSADVAMALGTDMSAAAQKLGKVLADPSSGLDGLKDIGIAFTAQEKEQIKAVKEANGLYEAQALVLDKVDKAYGKSATSIGNSTANLLTKINETWGDIKTSLGQGLLDAVSPALEKLYSTLSKISGWIDRYVNGWDTYKEIQDSIKSNSGSFLDVDLSKYTEYELEKALELAESSLEEQKKITGTFNALVGVSSPGFTGIDTQKTRDAIIYELSKRKSATSYSVYNGVDSYSGVDVGETTPEWKQFLSSYGSNSTSYQVAQLQEVIDKANELRSQMRLTDPSSGVEKYNKTTREAWGIDSLDEFKELYKQLGEVVDTVTSKIETLLAEPVDSTIQDILSSYGSLSESFQKDQTAESIAEIQSALDSLADGDSAKTYLQEILESLTTINEEADNTISNILTAYGSLSESYQDDQTAEKIQAIKTALDSLDDGDTAKVYLQEIYDAMTAVEEESNTLKEQLKSVADAIYNCFSTIASSLSTIWSNQADQLKATMQEQEEAGELTVAQKQEMQEEIDKLNRKAFEANKTNSLASATVSLANTIIGIIEQQKGNPVTIGILSALATASWGAQVAAIESQNYTPMATGGIVTGPTHALIGEAGPEAIIPLKDKRAQGLLGNNNPVSINITIQGNADEEVVFNAIERAQRTGLLPSWRYAQ